MGCLIGKMVVIPIQSLVSHWELVLIPDASPPPDHHHSLLPPPTPPPIYPPCATTIDKDDFNKTMVATPTQPSVGHREPDPSPDTSSMFPTEVYERIIDFLACSPLSRCPYGLGSLVSCCLTSRSWFPRGRFHLYFEIRLRSRARFAKFVRCLDINPSNGDFVRELLIFPSRDQGWVPAVPLALAPKLKNISTLALGDLDSTSLCPSFFEDLSAFSAVSELELIISRHHKLSLTQIVSAFPSLRKLTSAISLPFDDGTATLAPAHQKKPLSLRHLSLSGVTGAILLSPLIVSGTPLTTLYFQSYYGSAEETGWATQLIDLFLSSCHTLRVIRLNLLWFDGGIAYPPLSFSSLPDLHHLQLHIHIKGAGDISTVARLLSTISARSLQFLQLDLSVEWYYHKILSTPAPWKVLNETFLLPNIHSTKEIAVSMSTTEEVFGLLPTLKTMNVVKPWLDEHFKGLWNKL